ncbi:MAG: hypothetical protein AAGF49_07610 [Pseudomonadota bacterium]
MQNRVDPFSKIHDVPDRGLFTGNRGALHDPVSKTLKHQRWASESWVICDLKPPSGDRPRGLMQPGRWTELFFLDEAVGLAAGHRPCHGCRKEQARAFRQALGVPRVSAMNALINGEMKRYLRVRAPEPRPICRPRELPDGAFFALGDEAFLKWADAAYGFRFGGYAAAQKLPAEGVRLTPEGTCTALRNGFVPVLHPSLQRA